MKCNVLDFGAIADGSALCTDAIQKAIDTVALNGGGEVIVPTGTYLTGDLILHSNIIFHLMEHAVLLGTRDIAEYEHWKKGNYIPADLCSDVLWVRAQAGVRRDYRFFLPGTHWSGALIRAVRAENISIIGEKGALINGQNCYDPAGEEHYRGPHAIHIYECKNIVLRGYTIVDSGNWGHSIWHSYNIDASHLSVQGGHDAFHIRGCENVKVVDCEFSTGDDCVAGYSNTNVLVDRCTLNSACSCLRFGGTNAVISNCHMYGPCKYPFRGSLDWDERVDGTLHPDCEHLHRYNTLAAFSYFSDFSMPIDYQPGNLVIDSCKIENVDKLFHFNFSGNEPWQANMPTTDVTFSNTAVSGIKMPMVAYGDEKLRTDIRFVNFTFSFADDSPSDVFLLGANFATVTMQDAKVEGKNLKHLIRAWDDGGKIAATNLTTSVPESDYITLATDEFHVECI